MLKLVQQYIDEIKALTLPDYVLILFWIVLLWGIVKAIEHFKAIPRWDGEEKKSLLELLFNEPPDHKQIGCLYLAGTAILAPLLYLLYWWLK